MWSPGRSQGRGRGGLVAENAVAGPACSKMRFGPGQAEAGDTDQSAHKQHSIGGHRRGLTVCLRSLEAFESNGTFCTATWGLIWQECNTLAILNSHEDKIMLCGLPCNMRALTVIIFQLARSSGSTFKQPEAMEHEMRRQGCQTSRQSTAVL